MTTPMRRIRAAVPLAVTALIAASPACAEDVAIPEIVVTPYFSPTAIGMPSRPLMMLAPSLPRISLASLLP